MKILVAGYYGFGNLGDELILSSVISQLKLRYSYPEITVLSANPNETHSNHLVRAVSRWDPIAVIREIWENDFLILGGGGLLQNKTSQWSLIYYLGLVALARILQSPVVLFAVGVESLKGTMARGLTWFVLSSPDVKITVRDAASHQTLVDIGLPANKIHITADPVFASPFGSVASAQPAKERYGSGTNEALLIPRFPCPASGRKLFSIVANALKEEKRIQVKGLLFQPGFERDWLRTHPGELILSEEEYISDITTADAAARLSEFEFVVSARFHGLVLAAMAGRPFIGIGDPQKVGRFCDLMKMPCLRWEATEPEVKAAIDRIFLKNIQPQAVVVNRLRHEALQTANHV